MKPTVYLATDHAGFQLKNYLIEHLQQHTYEVVDCGADEYDETDDFPDYVRLAAQAVSEDPATRRAIILGGSGQGEAMAANRFLGVRAVVYYGEPTLPQTDADGRELSVIASTRLHNDANVLSLGARFISSEDAKAAVLNWLQLEFSGDVRHQRRISKLDQ